MTTTVVYETTTEPLSNTFAPEMALFLRGSPYLTVEHLFYASMYLYTDASPACLRHAEAIRRAETIGAVRYLARRVVNPTDARYIDLNLTIVKANDASVSIDPRWTLVQLTRMRRALRIKFALPVLREILLGTGDTAIQYHSADRYWGCGDKGDGENWMGRLLMELREEIRDLVEVYDEEMHVDASEL